MHFVRCREYPPCDECYISVIDTKLLLKSQNVIVYVPSLRWLGDDYNYSHEYLAHGVISGPALQAVPVSAFNRIGIPINNNYCIDLGIRRTDHRRSEYYPAITATEVGNALSVATQFGDDFVVPVVIAILSLQKRDSCLWTRCSRIEGLDLLANQLQDYNVPDAWCQDEDILTDIVEAGRYGEVDQTIRLLRALLHYRHGKGARGRLRQLEMG